MLFYHANQLGIIIFHHAVLTVVSVIKRSLRSALRSHARRHVIQTPVQTTVRSDVHVQRWSLKGFKKLSACLMTLTEIILLPSKQQALTNSSHHWQAVDLLKQLEKILLPSFSIGLQRNQQILSGILPTPLGVTMFDTVSSTASKSLFVSPPLLLQMFITCFTVPKHKLCIGSTTVELKYGSSFKQEYLMPKF